MSEKPESRYADQLRKLGFEILEPGEIHDRRNQYATMSTDDDDESEQGSANPLYYPKSEVPCFVWIEGVFEMTFAVDEHEKHWVVLKIVDLTSLGFSKMFEAHPLQ